MTLIRTTERPLRRITVAACLLGSLVAGRPVFAGGSAENLLLIVDPANATSKYVANYYRNARNVPDTNIIYVSPLDSTYQTFYAHGRDAVQGTLANRLIADHIDYILVPPGGNFYIPASGLVGASGCPSPVTRFATSSVYTLLPIGPTIMGGALNVMEPNGYYGINDTPVAFSNSKTWLNGLPSNSGSAKRYYIGFMLGYDGLRGNTLAEILSTIDRSVAVDGTHPPGTFYFIQTDDPDRSPPRDPYYPAAVTSINNLGGNAVELFHQTLPPPNAGDCLGVMTGSPNLDIIDGPGIVFKPGSYCDNITSWGATFDNSGQTKLSEWFTHGAPANGASGSMGTVEEPCTFGTGIPGKFTHPRLLVWYFQGMTLGESVFRATQWAPFQSLYYGDPLTQPFAYIPTVTVPGFPGGSVSGTISLTPVASTTRPGALIGTIDLFIDGLLNSTIISGNSFSLNTTTIADGIHDVRIIARDNSTAINAGRFVSTLNVNNFGRSATLGVTPASGPYDRSTLFTCAATASGGTVTELRLLQNGRVVAAGASGSQSFQVLGDVFGAGPVRLVAEAFYSDGRKARSAPVVLNIDFANAPPTVGVSGLPPVVYSYTKDVANAQPLLVELPATDPTTTTLSYGFFSTPAQATIDGAAGPFILVRPSATATGTDTLTYSVGDGASGSGIATVTLRYTFVPADHTAPTPNPMTFLIPPTPVDQTSLSMRATLATDASNPPVQYNFVYQFGAGGHDSGWQNSQDYTDTGLLPNRSYNYHVQARDSATPTPNVGSFSGSFGTVTAIESPTGISFGTVTANSIQVTATGTFTFLTNGNSGIFFEMTPPVSGSGANQWVQTQTINVTGLSPGTSYSFRVKSRNSNALENPFVGPVGQSTIGATGDCDGNGIFQLGPDTDCFAAVLVGTNTDPGSVSRSDINNDGVADGRDIALFVNCAISGCP